MPELSKKTRESREKLIRFLKKARDGEECVVDGVVWLITIDPEEGDEVKFSPHGLTGDYDTDCYWGDLEEVIAELGEPDKPGPGTRVVVDGGRVGTVARAHAMGDMADVDFGNGDVQGITYRRMARA